MSEQNILKNLDKILLKKLDKIFSFMKKILLLIRLNIVLTRRPAHEISEHEDVLVAASYQEALDKVDTMGERVESCWVIGGSSVYQEAIAHPRLDKIYITRILRDYDCDTFFPPLDLHKWKDSSDKMVKSEGVQEEEGTQFRYHVYQQH